MIFLTLLCLSLSRLSASHPLPHFLPQSITNEDVSVLDPRSNPDLFTQRSLWNIVQSCLATIFACTWIAVHPNIPAPKDGEGRVVARRLAIMGYMLLAPEIVIMWTARQYLASSEISQRHRGMFFHANNPFNQSPFAHPMSDRQGLDKGSRVLSRDGRVYAL